MRLAGVICSLLIVALVSPAHASSEDTKNCEQLDVSTISSPDGSWTARMYGEVCDLHLSSSAAVVVELVRAGSTTFRQVVLGMSMPSAKSGWPSVAWESSTRLAIDLPSSAEIGLQVAHFQGIDVDVRFCPRDPAVRAAWLAYRKAYRQWLTGSTVRPTAPATGLTCSQ